MGLIDPLEAPEPIHQYITIKYNSSKKKDVCTSAYSLAHGTLAVTKSEKYEYAVGSQVLNRGTYILQENYFIPAEDQKKRIFAGWQLRKKKKGSFVWLNDEGNWVEKTKETQESLKIFLPGDAIPVIEDSKTLFACAVWK